jgi:hypothetical protein
MVATMPVQFTTKPRATVSASVGMPIVCTANAASATKALEDWAALLASQESTLVRTAIEGGVRVQFGACVDVAELARLTMAEHDCCRFFSFAITVDHRGVGLDVVGPLDALPVVHAMFGGSK